MTLHQRNRGFAIFKHHFDRLVVHRVFFTSGVALTQAVAIAIHGAAFEHTVDVIGLALLFEVGHHAVHFFVADKGAVHADRKAGAAGHVQHVAHA